MKKGWQKKSLGEILQLEYGKPLDDKDRKPNGRFPVYGANGEKDRTDKFYHDKPSIVVGRKGSAGEINLTEKKFWPLDVTYFVTFDDKQYDLRFLYYLLTTLELPKLAKGVKPGINRNEVYSLTTNVPPLAEQRRIVEVLDEAFAGLAIAQANAEKNLQNARALFESHLQSVFTRRSEGWVETTIGHCIRFIDYRGKTPIKTESGIRLITAKNVKMGYLQETPMEFIAASSYKSWMTRGIPQRGDVLFTTEAPLANVAQLDTDEKVAFAQRIIIMQADTAKLNSTFLKYLLLSQPVQQRIRTKGTGATVQGIKASLLKTIEISFPKTLGEQEKIVSKLDALVAETQRLARLYEQKQAALAALKKSLLHQAFTGELTHELRESKIIRFPVAVPNTTTTDLHAGILAMAYRIHEQHGKQAEFGHVKGEKISHLIESLVGIDLGRMPVKDAAGPNDFPHLQKVEHRAKMAGYFLFQRAGGAYRVTKYRKFDELLARTESVLGERRAEVDRLLDLMWPMTARQAEVFATVFAAWNNLLLDGEPISDERIVQEARENWHPDKLKIPREKFFAAITWIKEKGICPEGKGKKVLNKAVKKGR